MVHAVVRRPIEVFSRQDRLEDGVLGNAIRAPLGADRKTNRRYWYYQAEPTPEVHLAYVKHQICYTETVIQL
jgi:hypothetical protein